MKLRFCLAFFLLISCRIGIAQVNLVQNGSFEILTTCPNLSPSYSTIEFAEYWSSPVSQQVNEMYTSPDLFAQCSTEPYMGVPYSIYGFQYPNEGLNYAGIILGGQNSNVRDFIQNELSVTLKNSCKYNLSFNFSYSSTASFKTSNLFFIFSFDRIIIAENQSIITGNYFNYNNDSVTVVSFPEILSADSANWLHIEKEFYTNSEARFLTIGNINDSLDTFLEFGWLAPGGGSAPQPVCRGIIDDIKLFQLDSTYCTTSIENVKEFDEIILYPNPSNTSLTIQSSVIKPGALVFMNDLSGRLIQKITLHESENFQFNTQHLANGTYWLSIQGADGKQQQERIIVMHE